MKEEFLYPKRGSLLRKNDNAELVISVKSNVLNDILLINGTSFITNNLSAKDLVIEPNNCYMIINNRMKKIQIKYSRDNSNHEIIYNPYKYEHSKKNELNPKTFTKRFNIPDGYIDILSKWYSIKFTYLDYNLIYIKPEMGISIQIHKLRSETWEILGGKPIIINDNKVYYFVEDDAHFSNPIKTFHSVINPNKNPEEFVIIKERWTGNFDEEDIERVFNPNNYY